MSQYPTRLLPTLRIVWKIDDRDSLGNDLVKDNASTCQYYSMAWTSNLLRAKIMMECAGWELTVGTR